MKELNSILIFFIISLTPIIAQEIPGSSNTPLILEASYTGDNVNNISGGLKTGSCYLGKADLGLNFDFQKVGLWKGTRFYVMAANTHGDSPSSQLLGDMQVASNIEAGNHTYLQQIWVKQAFLNLEFTVGLQDLNVEFANSEHGALFLNSSFGILPIISSNFTAPIFPLTTIGFTTKWTISDKFLWINALYDGKPTDFDYNPYNTKWQFISGDGLLAISEFQYHTRIKDLPASYKLGMYTHSHIVENSFGNHIPDSLNHNLFGIYAYADQKLWINDHKSLGMFAQLGFSPSKASVSNFYLGLGISYSGLLSKQHTDALGFAIAHEGFRNTSKHETTLELTYQYFVYKNLYIQPDFQYIIDPAGTDLKLSNCFAGNFRFGFSF
jgi:Carbohydrate-selective porin